MKIFELAVSSKFWECFWDFAEESDLSELMPLLCTTMVPPLCPQHEQWLASNEACVLELSKTTKKKND